MGWGGCIKEGVALSCYGSRPHEIEFTVNLNVHLTPKQQNAVGEVGGGC